jgi:hypothetical protein
MESVSLAAVARVAVDDLREGREEVITPALAAELASAIEVALLTVLRTERRACAAECTRRGELWQRAAEKAEIAEHARHEAESRANEALYLGDLIAMRTPGA